MERTQQEQMQEQGRPLASIGFVHGMVAMFTLNSMFNLVKSYPTPFVIAWFGVVVALYVLVFVLFVRQDVLYSRNR